MALLQRFTYTLPSVSREENALGIQLQNLTMHMNLQKLDLQYLKEQGEKFVIHYT